jgi:hypothetical protein
MLSRVHSTLISICSCTHSLVSIKTSYTLNVDTSTAVTAHTRSAYTQVLIAATTATVAVAAAAARCCCCWCCLLLLLPLLLPQLLLPATLAAAVGAAAAADADAIAAAAAAAVTAAAACCITSLQDTGACQEAQAQQVVRLGARHLL